MFANDTWCCCSFQSVLVLVYKRSLLVIVVDPWHLFMQMPPHALCLSCTSLCFACSDEPQELCHPLVNSSLPRCLVNSLVDRQSIGRQSGDRESGCKCEAYTSLSLGNEARQLVAKHSMQVTCVCLDACCSCYVMYKKYRNKAEMKNTRRLPYYKTKRWWKRKSRRLLPYICGIYSRCRVVFLSFFSAIVL